MSDDDRRLAAELVKKQRVEAEMKEKEFARLVEEEVRHQDRVEKERLEKEAHHAHLQSKRALLEKSLIKLRE